MVKRLLTILLLVISVMSVSAQRKQINQALDYLKSGKDYDKAEKLMDDLLKDSTNRKKEKIWQILIAAQKAQYEQGNEKLYLNEKYDTAKFFLMAKKLFQTMERFDSKSNIGIKMHIISTKSESICIMRASILPRRMILQRHTTTSMPI